MSIPNPFKLRLDGKRQVAIDEDPQVQVGTDLDHMNLYPEITPHARTQAPETLTDSNCIFVDHSGGNDANPGTEASPKKTFDSAITKADTSDDYKYFCCISTSYTYVEDVFFSHKYTKLYSFPVWYNIYEDSVICYIRRIKRTVPALTDANCIFTDFKNGNDSTGTGTQTNPYKTLQKACNIAYAAGSVDKYIGILIDRTYTETDYTSNESVEVICPTSGNRKIHVVWRDAADEFKAGVIAQINFEFLQRSTSSVSYTWHGFYFESGKFQVGGLDTIYASGDNGANGYINYSTDGINWSTVTTSPFPQTPYRFEYINIAATDTLFVVTNSGIYKSTDGLNWVISSQAGGDFKRIVRWNNNLVAVGDSTAAIIYTSDDTSWSTIDSVSGGLVTPVVIDNYLYYYDATNNKIKRFNSSWTASDVVTISEINSISDFAALNGKLYISALNTGIGMFYFIEVETDGSYTIIYSRSYTGTAYPQSLLTIDERVYIPCLADSTSLYAYDGNQFYDIGDTTSNDVRHLDFGFWNRLYYATTSSGSIKYALIDCITSKSEGSSSCEMYGLTLNGNSKKAAANSRVSGYVKYCKAWYAYTYCFYAPTTVYNNIIAECKYGVYSTGHFLYNCLLYNIIGITAYTASFVAGYNTNNIHDNASSAFHIANQTIGQSIFSRVSVLDDSSTDEKLLELSLLQQPILINDMITISDNNIYGTAIFRNRDAINQDFPDYRLQTKWVMASNGQYYKFDSLGVGMLSGPTDPGCYQYTRSVYSNTYKYSWEIDWSFNDTKYQQNFENLSTMISVDGTKKITHEGEPNQLSFSWIPDTPTENLDLKTLYTMLKLNESLRLTLNHWFDYNDTDLVAHAINGDLGIFSGPSEVGGGNVYATFDPDEMTLVQTENTWLDNEFKGWLVYISYDDSGTRKFIWLKIIKNTEDTLYLQDVDGLYEIPAAAIDNDTDDMIYIIGSMYVRCDTKSLNSNLAMWTNKSIAPRGALQITFQEA